MSTAVVKNAALGALVLAAVVLMILLIGNGPSTTGSATVGAPSAGDVSGPAPTTAATVPTTTVPPTAGPVDCPAGTVATAAPGPAPAPTVPGHMWTPASYPTSGWCEVPG